MASTATDLRLTTKFSARDPVITRFRQLVFILEQADLGVAETEDGLVLIPTIIRLPVSINSVIRACSGLVSWYSSTIIKSKLEDSGA
jgi:hypothetical protein